ncbi:MAG: LptA/OstA family protein [Akkermansia sp.]
MTLKRKREKRGTKLRWLSPTEAISTTIPLKRRGFRQRKSQLYQQGGETSNAQADKITYNAKTGEIILTGSPVIITPDAIIKNPNKDAFIRVYSNGNMYSTAAPGHVPPRRQAPTGTNRKPTASRELPYPPIC